MNPEVEPLPGNDVTLGVSDLSVRYASGAVAVQGVNLRVPKSSTVAVLGRNGAGKTSLLRGISGFLRSEHVTVSGRAIVDGCDVAGMTPGRANRNGVILVPERDKVFPSLTVGEHFRMIAPSSSREEATSGFAPLDSRWLSRAGLLSGGERQMLALAVAWLQRPKILLIDEMSLGLAPVVVKDLMCRLREISAVTGVATVVVEQDAMSAIGIADYVYILDRGRVVWEGRSSDATAKELSREYLGTQL